VGDTGGASPHFFRQWGYNMPCPPTFFSLDFVIYWFHTKLSPSHFTTKLRSKIKFIWFLHWQFICRYDTYRAQEPGSLSWGCAVMSLQFTHVRCYACLQKQVAKLACRLFYSWVLLRNNNMATNLHVLTLRFAACKRWTQVMQEDSEFYVDSHI